MATAADNDKALWAGESVTTLRTELTQRLEALRMARLSWWSHWQELAKYILPRRYRWLVTANQWNRGSQINQNILNSTGTLAARNCASGIMSGTTSPSRPWFRMTVPDPELMADEDVQIWCDETTKRMMHAMAESNYYGAKAQQYFDLVVFGTAPMIIYAAEDTVIRCFNPCAGEYFCAVGPNLDVNTLYREFTMTATQLVAEFGKQSVSQTVRDLVSRGRAGAFTEIIVRHAIEPNPEYDPNPRKPGSAGLPRHFRFREVYWEASTSDDKVLRLKGFFDQPFSCPRWDTSGNDAYGRSPAMDALGDVKQLQLEEKRKAQAIDKMVNPPMIADASMKNEPASLLPGAVTYVPQLNGGVGFKPAFQINPNIAELKEDIAKTEARIKDAFFNDLFLMISQLDTVRTATEIDARREEKLIMIGPAMDRLQREGLAADLRRIYAILERRRMLPPVPEVLKGRTVKVEYISLLADLQRATATTAIERMWGFAGNIGAAKPEALDNLDADASLREYAALMRVPPKIMATKQQVAAARKARNDQQQMAMQQQMGMEAVQAGKVLSETDVGGGQNALASIMGGGGV